MNSRDKILGTLKKNKYTTNSLPILDFAQNPSTTVIDKFKSTLKSIGGTSAVVDNLLSIGAYVDEHYTKSARIVNMVDDDFVKEFSRSSHDPHSFETVQLAILQAQFGVAENGAVWITDNQMGNRVLPFICEDLALVINKQDIVETLHDAYDRISNTNYQFGIFIAGPSKTADIEQSLVLGAHGPKQLIVFMLS